MFDPYSEVKLSIIALFNVPNLRQLLFTFLFASFWNWNNILLETVFWSELRFDEGGRYVVCSLNKNEKDFKVWTPKDFNARTKVHEYGGGAFFVYDGAVYFSNFSDQQMYVQKSPDSSPEAITPKDCNWRYADGSLCSKVIILIWIFKNINWTVFRYHIFITCLHFCVGQCWVMPLLSSIVLRLFMMIHISHLKKILVCSNLKKKPIRNEM